LDSISIIVRTKNEQADIGILLEKIRSQEVGMPVEVIVVDSGSTDSTVAIAKKYTSGIFPIPAEQFSFGYALNYGIERASGSIIVDISAHCEPTDNFWLRELVAPIANGSAHATFGRQVAIRGRNVFEEVSLNKHFPAQGEIPGRQPFSNANCAFLKKLWFEQKFDEELSSWEDYLWYFLLKDKYIFRYCAKGAVYHTHFFSLKAIAKRAYIDGRAFKLIKMKYGIDLLGGACPTLKTKAKIFIDDMKNHARLFIQEGHTRYIFLIPVVRFLAYRAYWDGYKSIK